MTKKEALQKIKELKQFITNLDKKLQCLQHGDLVTCRGDKRIIICTCHLIEADLSCSFLALDKYGNAVGHWGEEESTANKIYEKISNVLED